MDNQKNTNRADRWTMDELKNTDDLTFSISILSQRRNSLNPYSPLSMKLNKAISTLENIKFEIDRFISSISAPAPEPENEQETEV